MEINLDNWYKPKIDRKKIKELSRRKDLPGLIHFFFYFLFLFIFGYLAYISWGHGGQHFSFLSMELFMHLV